MVNPDKKEVKMEIEYHGERILRTVEKFWDDILTFGMKGSIIKGEWGNLFLDESATIHYILQKYIAKDDCHKHEYYHSYTLWLKDALIETNVIEEEGRNENFVTYKVKDY